MSRPTSSQKASKHNHIAVLAQQWARRYVQNCVHVGEPYREQINWFDAVSQSGREQTARRLIQSLRTVSLQAWNKTEMLLADQVRQQRIDPEHIDPWAITADSFRIYTKALDIYTHQVESRPIAVEIKLVEGDRSLYDRAFEVPTQQVSPSRLFTILGDDIGAMRHKYTSDDPRVIGFVGMQLHYTSQILLDLLPPLEQVLVGAYFKVIDDHLYMPLQRAFEAAATYDYAAPPLVALRQWLPVSSTIARTICQHVVQTSSTHHRSLRSLRDRRVQASIIRDLELFQVYLWVCMLEGNMAIVQQELFPLCIMLYPPLKVRWDLVRQTLNLLRRELCALYSPDQLEIVMPYFRALWQMFSPDVIGTMMTDYSAIAPDQETFWQSKFGRYIKV